MAPLTMVVLTLPRSKTQSALPILFRLLSRLLLLLTPPRKTALVLQLLLLPLLLLLTKSIKNRKKRERHLQECLFFFSFASK